MNKTLFLLMAEFGTTAVPLDQCYHYLGYPSIRAAEDAFRSHSLPVPCIRARESQKAPKLVMLEDLAEYLDQQANAGRELFRQIRSAA